VFLTCNTNMNLPSWRGWKAQIGSEFSVLVSRKEANKTWDGSCHWFKIEKYKYNDRANKKF
jgi:hypothetical protein